MTQLEENWKIGLEKLLTMEEILSVRIFQFFKEIWILQLIHKLLGQALNPLFKWKYSINYSVV